MQKRHISVLVAVLLAVSVLALVVGCTAEEEPSNTTAGVITAVPTTMYVEESAELSEEDLALLQEGLLAREELSTFENKDPFIQQVVPGTDNGGSDITDTTVQGGGTASTDTTSYTSTTRYTMTTRYTTTTRYYNTTTTRWTTTTRPTSTTTTSTSTTTTTVAHVHTLKVLSVDKVDEVPTVTFKVDNSVYKNRCVGDVVSTSWGQVKIVDIALSSKVVTLLHGSETLTLEVGDLIYE